MITIDKIRGWQLILFGIILTFGFALIYLTLSDSENGLVIPQEEENSKIEQIVSFGDALYFSVVTEATLGYGDIRPVGISRLFACIQVFLGLFLAGVIVAKITGINGAKLREAAGKSQGYWVEVFKKEYNYYLTFAHMFIDGNELRYNGENYNSNGQFEGAFKGKLISRDGDYLTFDYFNIEKKHLFEGGISDVIFTSVGDSKKWTEYRGICYDHGRTEKTHYVGFRATKNDIETIKGVEIEKRKELILNHINKGRLLLEE